MNEKTTGFQDKLMKYMMPVATGLRKTTGSRLSKTA